MRVIRRVAVGAAIAAAVFASSSLPASGETVPASSSTVASKGDVGVQACGYFTSSVLAYYNHCLAPGGPYTEVEIQTQGTAPRRFCVKPGWTQLGYIWDVSYAYYTGRVCRVG